MEGLKKIQRKMYITVTQKVNYIFIYFYLESARKDLLGRTSISFRNVSQTNNATTMKHFVDNISVNNSCYEKTFINNHNNSNNNNYNYFHKNSNNGNIISNANLHFTLNENNNFESEKKTQAKFGQNTISSNGDDENTTNINNINNYNFNGTNNNNNNCGYNLQTRINDKFNYDVAVSEPNEDDNLFDIIQKLDYNTNLNVLIKTLNKILISQEKPQFNCMDLKFSLKADELDGFNEKDKMHKTFEVILNYSLIEK